MGIDFNAYCIWFCTVRIGEYGIKGEIYSCLFDADKIEFSKYKECSLTATSPWKLLLLLWTDIFENIYEEVLVILI